MVDTLSHDVGLYGDIVLLICYVWMFGYIALRYLAVDFIIYAISVARRQFDRTHFEQPLIYSVMGFIMLTVLRDAAVNQAGNIRTHLDSETNEQAHH